MNSDRIGQVMKDIEEDEYKYVGVSEAHSFEEKVMKDAFLRIQNKTETGTEIKITWEI